MSSEKSKKMKKIEKFVILRKFKYYIDLYAGFSKQTENFVSKRQKNEDSEGGEPAP